MPALLPAKTLDLTGYYLTLDEPFTVMSISDSKTHDGSRWYAKNEECCMSTDRWDLYCDDRHFVSPKPHSR